MTRRNDAYPVRWTDGQAVVTLPGHIDVSNAEQVSELLLMVINRGATELIGDMTATVSCDHAGAAALARAYRRAVANGTQLRLVITAGIVRRVLSLNGLDRVIPVYPSLDAAAARTERSAAQRGPEIAGITPPVSGTIDSSQAANQADSAGELLGWVVDRVLAVGVLLQGIHELPPDALSRVTEALDRLDDVVRHVREHVFAKPSRNTQPYPGPSSALLSRALSAHAAYRNALLAQRAGEAARALQRAAADAAALLEQRADLIGQAGRMDYSTEIKRWRAFAIEAEEMAKRWEQPPAT